MSVFHVKISHKDLYARVPLMFIDQVTASTCTDAADLTSEETFSTMTLSNVNANVSDISNPGTRYGNIKLQNTKQVDSETLAKRWNIDLGKSKKIVTRTVQCGFRSCLHPILGHRYLNNDQMLRYKHMLDPVYAETLNSGIVSKHGNKYGQSY